jgi:hypothetical protein
MISLQVSNFSIYFFGNDDEFEVKSFNKFGLLIYFIINFFITLNLIFHLHNLKFH